MVSLVSSEQNKYNGVLTIVEEYRGFSTDTKPVLKKSRNGSTFFEMDTGEAYMYDGDTLTWILL